MSQTPPAGGQMGYQPPPWYTQMQQSNPQMQAPAVPQMPWAQQFSFPQDGGAPVQQPGLMANPSVFQFIQSMLQQPGGTPGGLPGYGTPYAGGAPAFNQALAPVQLTRDTPPPVASPPTTGGTGTRGDRADASK